MPVRYGQRAGLLAGAPHRIPLIVPSDWLATSLPGPGTFGSVTAVRLTVYECDACGARSLGDQRCGECSTWMPKLGVGRSRSWSSGRRRWFLNGILTIVSAPDGTVFEPLLG